MMIKIYISPITKDTILSVHLALPSKSESLASWEQFGISPIHRLFSQMISWRCDWSLHVMTPLLVPWRRNVTSSGNTGSSQPAAVTSQQAADMTHHSCLIELLVFPPIHVNVDDVTRGVARVTWPWNSKNHLAEICTLASSFQFYMIFTARCTLVQSAVLGSHVVCLSVCDVGELWSHRLEFFEINFTVS